MIKKRFIALALLSILGSASALAEGRVLVIGDSHTAGPFGVELDRLLQIKNPHVKLEVYGMAGTSTWSYFTSGWTAGGYRYHDDQGVVRSHQQKGAAQRARAPKVEKLLEKKPTVTVIALGSNQLGLGKSAKQISEIQKMIRAVKASGSDCLWVGPPKVHPDPRPGQVKNFKEDDVDNFYKALESVAAQPEYACTVFNSRVYEHPDSGDGMHFYGAKLESLARQWAAEVQVEVQKKVYAAVVSGAASNGATGAVGNASSGAASAGH